jgi:hypothetical protein
MLVESSDALVTIFNRLLKLYYFSMQFTEQAYSLVSMMVLFDNATIVLNQRLKGQYLSSFRLFATDT